MGRTTCHSPLLGDFLCSFNGLGIVTTPAAGPSRSVTPIGASDGDIVNLGIGIPTLAVDYIPDSIHIILQSENGFVGLKAYHY